MSTQISTQEQEKQEYIQKLEGDKRDAQKSIDEKLAPTLAKLDAKLSEFTQQEKFQSLPNASKIDIFSHMNDLLSKQRNTYTAIEKPSYIIEYKIDLFNGIIATLD